MKNSISILLSSLILSSFASTAAHADPHGNAKPRDSLTLMFSGNIHCSRNGLFALDTVINRDGTSSPFTIPKGYALVITDMDLPGMLYVDNGTTAINLLGPRYTTTDTHYTDLVVYPDALTCAYTTFYNDPTKELIGYRVRGHLIKDN